ncbi:MAG: adenylate/guanylate cyclase domain-containing protein [bacterium]|nr:adenylate/guanylate cyclase domain-containing protein [bacterium]
MSEMIDIEELKRTDSNLGRILNYLFDGVYIVDRSMDILFWNRGAELLTGYFSQDVVGHRCADDILNHIDENGVRLCKGNCPLRQTFKSGQPTIRKVYPLRNDGRRFPVMTHVAPILNEAGEIIAAIEVFRDISQEEELRIMQEKFAALIKRYVSTTTVASINEQIQTNEDGKVEIRELTVLYLDVVAFTPFSEKNPPFAVVNMLNELFGLCGVITGECNGDIDKFIGDSIMAVFVDANDAVDAATKILAAHAAWNTKRLQRQQSEIRVRIGIHSGFMVQAEIGTLNRKDVTVIGDAVNTAARIQSSAEPNTIAISEATWSRLKQPQNFYFYQELKMKGKSEPQKIFLHKQ